MDVADAIPINVSMPTPSSSVHAANLEDLTDSHPNTPPTRRQRIPSAASAGQGSFAAAASLPTHSAAHQPSPAHSTEAPPLYIHQLRSQLQRMEARQIEFIAESKFPPTPTKPTAANPTASPSIGVGNTEVLRYSSNAENDAFD
ncbi:hypothetical protein GQ457_01G021930 [Hibiscus cannabinus]